jgi:hypothetical protein
MITCHSAAIYVGTREPLTAKIAKKQREERQEKQQSCFAFSPFSLRSSRSKALVRIHLRLRTAWPGIVAGEGLNPRLPIQPKAGQSMGF